MYDARVADIPLFLMRRGGGGRRELFRYDIMDICLGKKTVLFGTNWKLFQALNDQHLLSPIEFTK